MFHVKQMLQKSRAPAGGGGGTQAPFDPRRGGVYIHWPFCESKCPYCDFNSHVSREIDVRRWWNAYLSELSRCQAEHPDLIVDSVFFGGGTPSLMPPDLVEAIIYSIRKLWGGTDHQEITLEANPSSVERGRFQAFRDAGVNRLSIGVQALDDAALRALGRRHGAAEARAAVDLALGIFPRVSADLIYARQGQGLTEWRNELREALSMGTSHLSLYQLTIEEGTPFATRHARGRLKGLPSEDLSATMFEETRRICAQMGLPAYEVSNHARTGHECRHNITYWMCRDFIGVGPGAHGRYWAGSRKVATVGHRAPAAWLDATERQGSGESLREHLGLEECWDEHLMMGLRLQSGISLGLVSNIFGRTPKLSRMERLIEDGLLEKQGDRLRATERGVLLLNSVIENLLADD